MSKHLTDTEIVVVGAGAMGACASLRLAQAGARVTLLEQRHPGSGTTQGSLAWANVFNKGPRSYFKLCLQSLRALQDLADECGGHWLQPNGSVHWANADDSVASESLQRSIRQIREWGGRVDEYTVDGIRDLEPDLHVNGTRVEIIYHVVRGAHVYAVPMVSSIIRHAREMYNVNYVRCQVERLENDAGTARVVVAGGQRIDADVVVLAAGADTPTLANTVGIEAPIERIPGNLAVTAPAPVSVNRVILPPNMSIRPDGGGRLVIGTAALRVSTEPRWLEPGDDLVQQALVQARAFLPGLRDVTIEATRTAVRAVPADGFPIIGFAQYPPNVYLALAHNAVTVAPQLAELIVEDMCGPGVADLEQYRPDRYEHGTTGPLGPAGD